MPPIMDKIYTIWNTNLFPKMPVITHALLSIQEFVSRHDDIMGTSIVIDFRTGNGFWLGACDYNKAESAYNVGPYVESTDLPQDPDNDMAGWYVDEHVYLKKSSKISLYLCAGNYDSVSLTTTLWHEMEHHRQLHTGSLQLNDRSRVAFWNANAYDYDRLSDYKSYYTSPWEIAARKKGEEGKQWFIETFGSSDAKISKKTKKVLDSLKVVPVINKSLSGKKVNIWKIKLAIPT
jgi:hypothetical protein